MECAKCKRELLEGSKFCNYCSEEIKTEKSKNVQKRFTEKANKYIEKMKKSNTGIYLGNK